MRNNANLALVLAVLCAGACASLPFGLAPAAAPPNTDIYTAELSMIDGKVWLGTPQPVAVGEGYDNQPAFLPGGNSILYTSAGPSGKTDLWQRDLIIGATLQLTDTPNRSEYSPRLTPDGTSLAYIQEDVTGEVTEVYTQPFGQNENASPASAYVAIKPVGYYAFLGQGEAVLTFLRDPPPSLQHTVRATGETRQIASPIGRALYVPRQSASGANPAFFTIERADGPYQVNRYDEVTGAVSPLFDLQGDVQDYAVFAMPDGARYGFFMAEETRLYFRTDRKDDTWQQVADLYQSGVTDITRLAVNDAGTRIAVVGQTGPKK